MRILLDERGWPRATIAEGPASDDAQRLALYVAAEFEESADLPQQKAAVEWLHLAKARHDLERVHCTDLSGAPRFGSNPPDFHLGVGDGDAVELAQFTTAERRRALGLLRLVKRAILYGAGNRFDHLRNRLVFLGFEGPNGLPPRATDDEAVAAVLAQLDTIDPGPGPRSLPETLDRDGFAVQLINQPLGSGAAACFPLPLLPQSPLAQTCGFEIAASMTVTVRVRDTEQELARLVDQHDVDVNDILLVSAGAPSRADGFGLVSEEVAVEPWIARTMTFPRPRHLKRILLHRWSFGDVYEIYPEYRVLVDPAISSQGGPEVIPVGRPPEWAWLVECPCGSGAQFRDCHGR